MKAIWRLAVAAILLYPARYTLPITLSWLRNQNPVLIALHAILEPPCTGAPSYQFISHDEVRNLGLRLHGSQSLWDIDAITIAKAVEERATILHHCDPNDVGTRMCKRAVKEAAKSLCYKMDQRYRRNCRLRLADRSSTFDEHYQHSSCQLEKSERINEQQRSQATDDACNSREADMLIRTEGRMFDSDLDLLLDPGFVWKKAIFDRFQLKNQRVEGTGECFTQGESFVYRAKVRLPEPTAGPTVGQYWIIYGTIVYLVYVLRLCFPRRHSGGFSDCQERVKPEMPVEQEAVQNDMFARRHSTSRRAGRVRPIESRSSGLDIPVGGIAKGRSRRSSSVIR